MSRNIPMCVIICAMMVLVCGASAWAGDSEDLLPSRVPAQLEMPRMYFHPDSDLFAEMVFPRVEEGVTLHVEVMILLVGDDGRVVATVPVRPVRETWVEFDDRAVTQFWPAEDYTTFTVIEGPVEDRRIAFWIPPVGVEFSGQIVLRYEERNSEGLFARELRAPFEVRSDTDSEGGSLFIPEIRDGRFWLELYKNTPERKDLSVVLVDPDGTLNWWNWYENLFGTGVYGTGFYDNPPWSVFLEDKIAWGRDEVSVPVRFGRTEGQYAVYCGWPQESSHVGWNFGYTVFYHVPRGPEAVITSHEVEEDGSFTVSYPFLDLTGDLRAEAPVYSLRYTFGEDTEESEISTTLKSSGSFDHEWELSLTSLAEGVNLLSLTGRDRDGYEMTKVFEVIYDPLLPALELVYPLFAEDNTASVGRVPVLVQGTLEIYTTLESASWHEGAFGTTEEIGEPGTTLELLVSEDDLFLYNWEFEALPGQAGTTYTVVVKDTGDREVRSEFVLFFDPEVLPELSLDLPISDGTYVTTGDSVDVSGSVTAQAPVQSVTVFVGEGDSGTTIPFTCANEDCTEITFDYPVEVPPGGTTVTVVVTDVLEEWQSSTFNVVTDPGEVVIALDTPTEDGVIYVGETGRVTLEGTATSSLEVEEVYFTTTGDLSPVEGVATGTNTWSFEVNVDRAGEGEVTVVARSATGETDSLQVRVVLDETPPELVVERPLPNLTIYNSSVTVEGVATDDSGVVAVTVRNITNAEEVEAEIQEDDGFSVVVDLDYGINNLAVTATDRFGNSVTESLQVIRGVSGGGGGGGGGGSTPPPPVNNPPVANNDSPADASSLADPLVTAWNTDLVIAQATLTANDTDDRGVKNIVSVGSPTAQGGAVVWDDVADTVTYTPPAGYTGSDSFTYSLSDGVNAAVSATVTVGVVVDVDTAPEWIVASMPKILTMNETIIQVSATVEFKESDPPLDLMTDIFVSSTGVPVPVSDVISVTPQTGSTTLYDVVLEVETADEYGVCDLVWCARDAAGNESSFVHSPVECFRITPDQREGLSGSNLLPLFVAYPGAVFEADGDHAIIGGTFADGFLLQYGVPTTSNPADVAESWVTYAAGRPELAGMVSDPVAITVVNPNPPGYEAGSLVDVVHLYPSDNSQAVEMKLNDGGDTGTEYITVTVTLDPTDSNGDTHGVTVEKIESVSGRVYMASSGIFRNENVVQAVFSWAAPVSGGPMAGVSGTVTLHDRADPTNTTEFPITVVIHRDDP